MTDYRSTIEKIEAVAAEGSGATEGERAAARAALDRLRSSASDRESTRGLSRNAILGAPDESRIRNRATVTIRTSRGVYIVNTDELGLFDWQVDILNNVAWRTKKDPQP